MDVHRSHRSLPGHPGCGMITIVYDFRGGVQVYGCSNNFLLLDKLVTLEINPLWPSIKASFLAGFHITVFDPVARYWLESCSICKFTSHILAFCFIICHQEVVKKFPGKVRNV